MRRAFLCGVLLVAAGATGSRAQSEIGTEFQPFDLSDTIIVTADRIGTSVRESASSITVLTSEQIEQSQATMVAELLRTVPGLDVVRSGGSGQQTSIFMRGANSEHTLVMVDGVELNDPSSPNNAVNLAHFPIENIERIEILRGPQSVLYGSDAVGGVIQIFTRQGNGRPVLTIAGGGGSMNTLEEYIGVGANQEDVDYALTLARKDTDGFSVGGDPDGQTEKDGYSNSSVSASFGLRPSPRVQLRFSGRLTEAETDLDQSFGVRDDPNYRIDSNERHFSARLAHDLVDQVWTYQLGAFLTYHERNSDDGTDADHPADASRSRYEGRRVKFNWQHDLVLAPFNRVTAGVETMNERLEQSTWFKSAWGESSGQLLDLDNRTSGVYVNDRISIADSWYTTVGWRWDDHEQFGQQTTYRVTTAAHLDQLGLSGLKVRASYGTGFKSPSLYQIYDPTYGNQDLQPETSRGWEVGIDQQAAQGRYSFGLAYFDTRFEDLIKADNTWRMANVAEARVQGGELCGEARFDPIRLRMEYTNTQTRDDATGEALVRRPRHKMRLSASVRLLEAALLRADAAYTGERYDTDYDAWPAERVTLADYWLVHLTGSYRLSPSVTLRARVDNVFDQTYEEILGYNASPAAVYLGTSLTL